MISRRVGAYPRAGKRARICRGLHALGSAASIYRRSNRVAAPSELLDRAYERLKVPEVTGAGSMFPD